MCDKAFNIDKYLKHDGYQRGVAWKAYNFVVKKNSVGTAKNENILNKELAEEVH